MKKFDKKALFRRSYLRVVLKVAVVFTATSWLGGVLLFLLYGLPLSRCYPWTIYQYYGSYGYRGSGVNSVLVTFCTFLPWLIVGYFALDRILHHKKKKLHGDARFATFDEINEAGFFPKGNKLNRTILVGSYKGKYLCYGGTQFVLLAAPTRSGKGVGIVIPNCLNYSDSLVVLDIKLENYRITSGFRKACGQEVYLFAPFDIHGRTCRYNPLSYISDNPAFRINDIDTISAALFSSRPGSDEFWNDQAKDMFRGICLFTLEQEGIPHTLGEMLRQASGKGMPLKDYIQQTLERRQKENKPFSSSCIDCLNRIVTMPDNTFGSVVATFNSKMKMFANVLVDMATSGNDFDLRDVRKKRMTIYFGVTPNKLADASGLVNLFFDQLINLNVTEMPEDNPEVLKYQCLMVMDEFTSIGKVEIINKSVSFQAGYNMRLLTIVQNKSQLEQCYGKEGATTLLSNHAVQIIYQPSTSTPNDANEYSDMIGYETVRNESKSISYNSTSESFSDQKRALMLPQELRELGDQEIVCSDRCKPFKCDKIKYYEDPIFMERGYGDDLGLRGIWPPAEVPQQDIDLFIAKQEKRIRPMTEEDCQEGEPVKELYSEQEFPAAPDDIDDEEIDLFSDDSVEIACSVSLSEVDDEDRQKQADKAVGDVFDDFMEEDEPAGSGEEAKNPEQNVPPESPKTGRESDEQTQSVKTEEIPVEQSVKQLSELNLDNLNFDTIFGGARP